MTNIERKSERFSKLTLEMHLRNKLAPSQIEWEPVEDDPPDYYLTLNGRRFAIECTSTRNGENGDYTRPLGYFVRTLATEALQQNLLNGTYILAFNQPLPNTRKIRKIKKCIQKQVMSYLEETAQDETSPLFEIKIAMADYYEKTVCWIMKNHNQSNNIHPVFLGTAAMDSPEFRQEACKLLQDAVNTKANKIRKKAEQQPHILLDPIILVLLNTNPLIEISHFKDCISYLREANFFHSIFLVQTKIVGEINTSEGKTNYGAGSILYSVDPTWQ